MLTEAIRRVREVWSREATAILTLTTKDYREWQFSVEEGREQLPRFTCTSTQAEGACCVFVLPPPVGHTVLEALECILPDDPVDYAFPARLLFFYTELYGSYYTSTAYTLSVEATASEDDSKPAEMKMELSFTAYQQR